MPEGMRGDRVGRARGGPGGGRGLEAVGYTEGLSLVVLDVVFVGTASGWR